MNLAAKRRNGERLVLVSQVDDESGRERVGLPSTPRNDSSGTGSQAGLLVSSECLEHGAWASPWQQSSSKTACKVVQWLNREVHPTRQSRWSATRGRSTRSRWPCCRTRPRWVLSTRKLAPGFSYRSVDLIKRDGLGSRRGVRAQSLPHETPVSDTLRVRSKEEEQKRVEYEHSQQRERRSPGG